MFSLMNDDVTEFFGFWFKSNQKSKSVFVGNFKMILFRGRILLLFEKSFKPKILIRFEFEWDLKV